MAANIIDQKRLKELLHYDPDTGVFTWKTGNKCVAGTRSHGHYVYIQVDGVRYLAHRLVWLYIYNEIPTGDIDHINRIKNDNRLINLRSATRKENSQNKNISTNNTSGITGVVWDKSRNKWFARIKIDYKTINLGRYTSKDLAIAARKNAEKQYFTHKVAA